MRNLNKSLFDRGTKRETEAFRFVKILQFRAGNYSIKKIPFFTQRYRASQKDEHLKYEIWKMVVFRRTSINEVQCAGASTATAASAICLTTGWKRALDRDVTIVRHGNIVIRV